MGFFNSKGEMTSSQIVTTVLSIGAFIIVLIFVAVLYEGGDRTGRIETCKFSVLSRATVPDLVQARVPLKCTTGKICISEGDDCPQFIGEKNVERVSVSGSDDEKIALMEETVARSLYECWNMMGRGQLNIFRGTSELFFGGGASSCVVCDRIAFSSDVMSSGLPASMDMKTYLETHGPDDGSGHSYVYLLTDRETNTFLSAEESDTLLRQAEGSIDISLEGSQNNQLAILFAQNKPVSFGSVLENWGYVAFAAGTSASRVPVVGTQAGFILGLGSAGLGVIGASSAYAGQLAAASYCGSFTSPESDFDHGCSLVQSVPYSVNDVNALCDSLEGSP